MTTQNIEVEVPDGYRVVDSKLSGMKVILTLEKFEPRRIVLEEISKEEYHRLFNDERCSDIYNMRGSYWREVKETDIPLTNDEPNVKMGVIQGDCDDQKLELSVKELRNVRSLIKDFENLGWFINPERALLLQKITEFIKDK